MNRFRIDLGLFFMLLGVIAITMGWWAERGKVYPVRESAVLTYCGELTMSYGGCRIPMREGHPIHLVMVDKPRKLCNISETTYGIR